MTYKTIYKIKILKEEKKLFDLGGKELVKLQESFIKYIDKIFKDQYKTVLLELKKDSAVNFNDLFINQKQFIEKDFSDFLTNVKEIISKAFTIGAKALNSEFKEDIKIDTTFSINPDDSVLYAQEFARNNIKNIDEYSRTRIRNLIAEGLKQGWGYRKLADELQKDYTFSKYRARLIASQELGQAYIGGKTVQFEKYSSEYGQKGWKRRIAHRDERTSDICSGNSQQGWIEAYSNFKSGHSAPLGHIGCRCTIVYRLFKPE